MKLRKAVTNLLVYQKPNEETEVPEVPPRKNEDKGKKHPRSKT